MNHYQTLGIEPEASAEEVKQAWRRKCSQHHPDKPGGDVDAMAQINRAYECLSDAKRRQAYDAAGHIEGEPMGDVDAMAQEALATFFDHAIKENVQDIVDAVRQSVSLSVIHALNEKGGFISRRDQLKKQRGRVRVKGAARNIAHAIIDPQIAQLNAQIGQQEQTIAVLELCRQILSDYESDVEAPAPQAFRTTYSKGQPFGGGRFTTW